MMSYQWTKFRESIWDGENYYTGEFIGYVVQNLKDQLVPNLFYQPTGGIYMFVCLFVNVYIYIYVRIYVYIYCLYLN